MKKIVNLTPHPIIVRGPSGELTFPASGQVARVGSRPGPSLANVQLGEGDLPLYHATEWGVVEGLPEPDQGFGTIYIVSSLVASRCEGRHDVFAPGTGPADGAIRDDAGRIVAVTRLIQAPQTAGQRALATDGRSEEKSTALAVERDRLARECSVYAVDAEHVHYIKRGEYPPVSRSWKAGDPIPAFWLRPDRRQVHPVQRLSVNANADYERTWFHQVAVARDGSEYVVLGSYGQCVSTTDIEVCPYCGAPEPFRGGWDCCYCGCN